MKDFTQLSESEAITALNKEIQRKDLLIADMQKQANYARQQIQHLSGQQNIYPEAQLNCNSCS
jgi:cell division protein FtsL